MSTKPGELQSDVAEDLVAGAAFGEELEVALEV